jgi:choline kinase
MARSDADRLGGRMKAVILAAGRGGRLRGAAGDRPKCLARIGTKTLVERQIHELRTAGLDDVVVVAGYHAADVGSVCGAAEIVHNTRYATTNSLYSLWLTRDLLADGFVVLNGDVLFHPQLLSDLLTARYDDALLMEAREATGTFTDEEMKVRVRRGCVAGIDKAMPPEEADGENIGIAKFGPGGAALLVQHMNEIVGAGGVREWVPRAFAEFCRQRPLHVVESRGYPWIEIDFPEDYWRACSEVLPAIDAVSGGQPAAASEQLGRTLRHV